MDDEQHPGLDPAMRAFAQRHRHRSAAGDTQLGALARVIATGRAAASPPVSANALYESARRHAARAFRASASDDVDDAALQFGIMLEHLTKAYLVDLHPTLLLERNFDLGTLLRLAGQGQRVKTGHVLKTIGLRTALERYGDVISGGVSGAGKKYADRFELLVLARDGVAHTGAASREADAIAQVAIRGVEEIVQSMGRGVDDFFGEWAESARTILDEHATEVKRLIQMRLSRAREVFAALSTKDRYMQASTWDATVLVAGDDSRGAVECPACQSVGVVTGTSEIDLEADWDTEGGTAYIVGVSGTIVLHVESFLCPVCGFRAIEGEQLTEAGVAMKLDLREATDDDLAEYAADYP